MGPVKTSVYLSEKSIEALKKLASKRGTSMAEVLRHAIATEDFLDEATSKGNEVLIKEGKTLKQLVRV